MDIKQATATIISSEFYNNSVKNTGGVIKVSLSSKLKMISSKFINNKARDGGVLYAIETNMIISDCALCLQITLLHIKVEQWPLLIVK